MATVSEVIPEALQREVDVALTWFNGTQADAFEVTGIVDADQCPVPGVALLCTWPKVSSAGRGLSSRAARAASDR
jgi:hypothetical protein